MVNYFIVLIYLFFGVFCFVVPIVDLVHDVETILLKYNINVNRDTIYPVV